MALIMTVYNMKRCINIIGIPELLKKIKEWKPDYARILFSLFKQASLNALWIIRNLNYKMVA